MSINSQMTQIHLWIVTHLIFCEGWVSGKLLLREPSRNELYLFPSLFNNRSRSAHALVGEWIVKESHIG